MMSVRCSDFIRHATLAGVLTLMAAPALAGPVIEDAWVRAVPPVSDSTAGYFLLRNEGEEDLVLTGFEADIVEAGEMHTWADGEDGTRHMQRLDEVSISAGEEVRFRSGGKHLMLFRLTDPLEAGDHHELCLEFAEAETVCADFEVRRDEDEGHDHHDH